MGGVRGVKEEEGDERGEGMYSEGCLKWCVMRECVREGERGSKNRCYDVLQE